MSFSKQKTFRLLTVGCRLNQYETEKMGSQLSACGFRQAVPDEPADLTIINTCTVTHRADSDCRYLVRRAYRDNPDGCTVVVGCYVEHEPDRLAAMEGVDLLISNSQKDDLVGLLREERPDIFTDNSTPVDETVAPPLQKRNRAWMKISDGCNQQCSFCLITKVRGPLVNRPADEIADETRQLVNDGFREVVLTGVNIGYYRDKNRSTRIRSLAELCRLIIERSGLHRLRLSSIEPQTVTDELLTTLADSNGKVCRHLHLPLQSGSDRILRMMRRPYNVARIRERLAAIRKTSPDILIGADVIVGFPGETDEDFEGSREVCASGLVDYMHVFSYSDRPGTPAAELPDKVNPEIIRRRSLILGEISTLSLTKAKERQVGHILEVISEHKAGSDRSHFAVSDNYLRVKLPAGVSPGREAIRVKVRSLREDFLECDLA